MEWTSKAEHSPSMKHAHRVIAAAVVVMAIVLVAAAAADTAVAAADVVVIVADAAVIAADAAVIVADVAADASKSSDLPKIILEPTAKSALFFTLIAPDFLGGLIPIDEIAHQK